jgi:hypothetical protein
MAGQLTATVADQGNQIKQLQDRYRVLYESFNRDVAARAQNALAVSGKPLIVVLGVTSEGRRASGTRGRRVGEAPLWCVVDSRSDGAARPAITGHQTQAKQRAA